MRRSQPPSPKGFLLWKLQPPPCAVLMLGKSFFLCIYCVGSLRPPADPNWSHVSMGSDRSSSSYYSCIVSEAKQRRSRHKFHVQNAKHSSWSFRTTIQLIHYLKNGALTIDMFQATWTFYPVVAYGGGWACCDWTKQSTKTTSGPVHPCHLAQRGSMLDDSSLGQLIEQVLGSQMDQMMGPASWMEKSSETEMVCFFFCDFCRDPFFCTKKSAKPGIQHSQIFECMCFTPMQRNSRACAHISGNMRA